MAQFPTEYGASPVGRLINGDPFNKQTKDANGREIPLDKQSYWFAIAVEKQNPQVNEMLGTLQKAAMAGYQQNPTVMQQINMGLSAPSFSWKVSDGDEMVADPATGQQRNRWANGAGCWIFKFNTTLPIIAAQYMPGASVPEPCDSSVIYRGCFVQVSYGTSANGNQDHTAGVYLNPRTVAFVGHGEPIVSGPSMDQQFSGGMGGYTPAGMTQTPQAPAGGMGQQQQNPMGGQAQGGMQQNGMQQNGMGGMQQNPMGGGMPGQGQGGMPGQQQGNPADMSTPPGGPVNPANNGGGMQGGNMNGGGTGSPTNGQYGGYMGQ